MSDKIHSRNSIFVYDPDVPVKCHDITDGSYCISLDNGELTVIGDLEVLLQIFAKAEALLEHEQIMRRKNENAQMELKRAQEG